MVYNNSFLWRFLVEGLSLPQAYKDQGGTGFSNFPAQLSLMKRGKTQILPPRHPPLLTFLILGCLGIFASCSKLCWFTPALKSGRFPYNLSSSLGRNTALILHKPMKHLKYTFKMCSVLAIFHF